MAAIIATASTTGGFPTSSAIDTTGANAICVLVSGTLSSDSKSNSWTLQATSGDINIYTCASPTVGSGHTFTAGANYMILTAIAMSDMDTASLLDAVQTASAQSSPASAASITPSVANSVAMGICLCTTNGQAAATTASTGYTQVASVAPTSSVAFGHSTAYRVLSSSSAQDPEWTFTSGTANVGLIVLKGTGGGGSSNGSAFGGGRALNGGRAFFGAMR